MSRMGLRQTLADIVDSYKDAKDEEKAIKKVVGDLNTQLKEKMLADNLDSIDGNNGYCVTLTTTQKESLNEERAIEILKEALTPAQLRKVVKKKEYIDDDELEKLVYNGKFDMSQLECCREFGEPTHTLRIAKIK
jgi:hypothetical protein